MIEFNGHKIKEENWDAGTNYGLCEECGLGGDLSIFSCNKMVNKISPQIEEQIRKLMVKCGSIG